MRTRVKVATGTLALAVLFGMVIAPASSQIPGVPAQVTDFSPPVRLASFDVTDFGKAMHARDGGKNTDQDLLYKIDITTNASRLLRLYEIGRGDVDASSGGPPADIRFDFNTVAILPDGRIAVSFLDSTTDEATHLAQVVVNRLGPALAIEL